MRPRTAGIGIVACVLFAGAFENPERDHVLIRTNGVPANTGGDKPLGLHECHVLLGIPEGEILATYNVSSWNAGGWPYYRTVCLYTMPTRKPTKKVSS